MQYRFVTHFSKKFPKMQKVVCDKNGPQKASYPEITHGGLLYKTLLQYPEFDHDFGVFHIGFDYDFGVSKRNTPKSYMKPPKNHPKTPRNHDFGPPSTIAHIQHLPAPTNENPDFGVF